MGLIGWIIIIGAIVLGIYSFYAIVAAIPYIIGIAIAVFVAAVIVLGGVSLVERKF